MTERAPGKRKIRPSSDYLPDFGPPDECTDNEFNPSDNEDDESEDEDSSSSHEKSEQGNRRGNAGQEKSQERLRNVDLKRTERENEPSQGTEELPLKKIAQVCLYGSL